MRTIRHKIAAEEPGREQLEAVRCPNAVSQVYLSGKVHKEESFAHNQTEDCGRGTGKRAA